MYVDPVGPKGCLKEGSKTSWAQDWAKGLLYGVPQAEFSPVPQPARLRPFPSESLRGGLTAPGVFSISKVLLVQAVF